MDDFEDDDDFEVNRPLDDTYVAVGLSMLVVGIFGAVLVDSKLLKIVCVIMLMSSFVVMTKRQKLGD